jgi:hypothetical protein
MVTLILEILGLAVGAWQSLATGGAAGTAKLTATLLAIAQRANAAYMAQTGKPIDPALLQDITPLP